MINLHLGDCMPAMRAKPDKAYDLAIVDMPYGIKQDGRSSHTRGGNVTQKNGKKTFVAPRAYVAESWDDAPPGDEYFSQLFRVSSHQVVWGANYFAQIGPVHKTPRREHLQAWLNDHPTGWIVWDKLNGGTDFNDFELAWTSFNRPTQLFKFMWNGMLQGSSIQNGHRPHGNKKLNQKRIHPTEKPRLLYVWTLRQYAEKGWIILDTGFGSGSIAMACYDEDFDLDAWDKTDHYHAAAVTRLAEYKKQTPPLYTLLW